MDTTRLHCRRREAWPVRGKIRIFIWPAPRRPTAALDPAQRMLHTPVALDDGQAVAVTASVGPAHPRILGIYQLSLLQRDADAALYDGKHSGQAVFAGFQRATRPSVNGRRLGGPGTALWGRGCLTPARSRTSPPPTRP